MNEKELKIQKALGLTKQCAFCELVKIENDFKNAIPYGYTLTCNKCFAHWHESGYKPYKMNHIQLKGLMQGV